MLKEGKKAQLYIMAAIIIIAILAGLLVVVNYVYKAEKPVKFYDLSEEISIESEKLVSHGIYQEKDTDKLIENFTDTYSEYFDLLAGKSDLIFVYGNYDNMTMITYTDVTKGRISLGIGESKAYVDVSGKGKEKTSLIPVILPENKNYVLVNISEQVYNFSLRKGENFFFVLTKQIGNETHVTQK
jgi:hypothetical protein